MAFSIEQYESEEGWSSKLFAPKASELMRELTTAGIRIVIHRTVIHLHGKSSSIKAYVHHNGRSPEYATLTTWRGSELDSFHHTEFGRLASAVKHLLCVET